MKSIFIKTIPYLFAFLAINLLFYLTSRFYKQERKYIDRIEYAIDSKPTIIFLGDSHVDTIKILDLSENVHNLAFGSDGIEEMYIKILIMIKYNPKLEYVFITTEPQIFNNSISSNSTFLNNYVVKLKDTLNVYNNNKSKLNLFLEKIPLLNDNFLDYLLDKIYINLRSKKNVLKQEWSSLSEKQRTENATYSGKSDHEGIMTQEYKLDIYREIVNICKFNNIKIIGVRFPVNEHYINQCSKEDLINVNEFIKHLKMDFNLDYLTEFNNQKYFENADHLNLAGIKKISQIISRDTNIKITK